MSTQKPPRGNIPMRLVWNPDDFNEAVQDAVSLFERAKDYHPATVSKLLQEADTELAADAPACPVIDLFTRERIR